MNFLLLFTKSILNQNGTLVLAIFHNFVFLRMKLCLCCFLYLFRLSDLLISIYFDFSQSVVLIFYHYNYLISTQKTTKINPFFHLFSQSDFKIHLTNFSLYLNVLFNLIIKHVKLGLKLELLFSLFCL